MSWPKPPPLICKPMGPPASAVWRGLPLKLVKRIVLLSMAFWLLVLFVPALILLFLFWPVLAGSVWGAVAVLAALSVGYVSLSLGMWASQKMVRHGHLQRALSEKAKAK